MSKLIGASLEYYLEYYIGILLNKNIQEVEEYIKREEKKLVDDNAHTKRVAEKAGKQCKNWRKNYCPKKVVPPSTPSAATVQP